MDKHILNRILYLIFGSDQMTEMFFYKPEAMFKAAFWATL